MKTMLKFSLLLIGTFSLAQNNLLDTSTWTVGTGGATGFWLQGTEAENVRELGTDPHGNQTVLWKVIPDGANDVDGGWGTTYLAADHTKTYRFTVWIKKTNSNSGNTYFGLYAYDSGNTRNSLNLDGSLNVNPYFFLGDLPQLDTWYLLVGFLHESGYSSTVSQGGIYDQSGVKVQDLTDFKFSSTSSQMRHRAYLYYATNTADRQFFWEPTIYEVNGQEPTVQDLLGLGGGSDTQAPTAPTLASTGHTDSTADLSWSGSTDDTAVTGYKIFKDGALEVTLGNVSTYQVTGLTAGTNYNFTATALDAAGNESTASNAVSVTTYSSGGGGGTVWNSSGNDINYTIGNVGIGTTTIGTWKLAVGGRIRAEEVNVETGWADYVFTEGYDLPTLEEVERHIQEKGHLINIPSAKEVEANGIEIGEMNKLLLEKIEELTLYILQQQKQIEQLKDFENQFKNELMNF
ncbi:fibronectin type III domain-containing protein [Ulvibacterium sp.]|uniref:fibronectin type III domain-containing protein n=1 Tax=Ulvibacterium sp. TaxID=2665914 RepID=UPI003BAD3025